MRGGRWEGGQGQRLLLNPGSSAASPLPSQERRISPTVAGLAITNALCFGTLLEYLAFAIAETLTCLAAVARVDHLSQLAPEEHWPEPGMPLVTKAAEGGRPAPDAALLAALRAPRRSGDRRSAYPYAGWDPECWGAPCGEARWPREGAILFDRVTARYAPGLPPALKVVSVSLKSRSTLGVVGRSGSGAPWEGR